MMKKWLILLVFLLLLISFAFIYFFVPKTEKYTYALPVHCTQAAASRFVLNTDRWLEWWPGAKTNEQLYHYNGTQYKINNVLVSGIETTVLDGTDSTRGYLQVLPRSADSCFLVWTSSFVRSANPFKRTMQFFQSGKLKNNISSMLNDTKKYLEKEEYVYGMEIVKQKVIDSCMVALKQTFDHYPSTTEIYAMVSSIKGFIKSNKGEETNSPMLNVYQESKSSFQVMVAIPTRNKIASQGKFLQKNLVMGSMLVAEVNGGVARVMQAEKEMDNYVKDYQKMSPAIPFQLLITDRVKEPDSTKWITKLYCPIYN
jgi:hypothetical protein